MPLLIQDRNFDLDERGAPSGRLLHKTNPDVPEAFAPFTVVNGKVWPVLDVQPSVFRFRVLNGSNARTSLNTARAPFDGSSFAAADAADAADLDGLLPYPQVMRFRVGAGATTRWRIPRGLATDYEPPGADALVEAPHRTIALVERELDGEPNMLTMRELAPAADDHAGRSSRLGRRADDALSGRCRPVRGHDNLLPAAERARSLAARQPDHCHILEHEDRDVMRPFVTMPQALMPFMA